MVALGLTGFDPVGWDAFGPIRWLALPALGFWLVALEADTIRLDPSPGPVLLAAFLSWGAIASVVAVDPLHAWIGTPDRRFGWLTWLLCGALFLVGRSAELRLRRAVIWGFVVGAIGLGCYTLAETIGLAIDVDFAGGRRGGPLGQPAYLGAAAALVTPIAAGVSADREAAPGWRLAGGAGAALGLVTLLLSQSRAAWLGALAGGIVWMVWGRRRPLGRPASATVAASALLGPVLVVVAVPALRRRITSSLEAGGVVDGRLDEWRIGLRAISRAPVLGYGPEGYRTVFGAAVDDAYVIEWGRDVVTDRAHSGPLDVALAFGVPGAAIYLALLAVMGLAAVTVIRTAEPVSTGLAVGVVAYAVQQLFLFPLSELDPLFWLAAGLVCSAVPPPGSAGSRAALGRSLLGGLAAGLAAVAALAGTLDLVANSRIAAAVAAPAGSERASGAVATAIRLRPDSTRYRFIGSRLARQGGNLGLASARVEEGLRRSSQDPALRGELARLELDLARATTAEPARTEALDRAVATLEALVDDDPHHPLHLQRLGIALALSGEIERATEVMERAVVLAPGRPEPLQNLEEIRRLDEDDESENLTRD